MLALWSDGSRQIRQPFLRYRLLAELLPGASVHLRGQRTGPHLVQVNNGDAFLLRLRSVDPLS